MCDFKISHTGHVRVKAQRLHGVGLIGKKPKFGGKAWKAKIVRGQQELAGIFIIPFVCVCVCVWVSATLNGQIFCADIGAEKWISGIEKSIAGPQIHRYRYGCERQTIEQTCRYTVQSSPVQIHPHTQVCLCICVQTALSSPSLLNFKYGHWMNEWAFARDPQASVLSEMNRTIWL